MADLKINGIDITFEATLSGGNFTLTGKNGGTTVSGYKFEKKDDPNKDASNYGIQYKIVEATSGSLTITHSGYIDEEIYVWTELPEDLGDVTGPPTKRGTEVIVG